VSGIIEPLQVAKVAAGGDEKRPVDSEILRITQMSGKGFVGSWRFSNGSWQEIQGRVQGDKIKLTASVGSETFDWILVRADPTKEEVVSNFMFDYPLYELSKLKVVGKDCFIYAPWGEPTAVKWSGDCEKSQPVGDGKILWLKNDLVIWIDNVGDEHGMVLRDGKLHIYKDLSETFISFMCIGSGRYGEVRLSGETKESLFHNSWLASALAERSIEAVVEECPPLESDFRRQAKYQDVKIEVYILPRYLNGQKIASASTETGTEFKWRHNNNNYTLKAVEQEIENENRRQDSNL
jgi:hypothetical protein